MKLRICQQKREEAVAVLYKHASDATTTTILLYVQRAQNNFPAVRASGYRSIVKKNYDYDVRLESNMPNL